VSHPNTTPQCGSSADGFPSMRPPHGDPAERSGYLRFFYRDWRSTRLAKIWNGAYALLTWLGLTPMILLTLQVEDRKSGRLCSNVLVVASHHGGHETDSVGHWVAAPLRA
jgi:hypothetical protein